MKLTAGGSPERIARFHSRDGQRRIRVERQGISYTPLEVEEPGPRDHRRVVGGEARRRGEDRRSRRLHSITHCRGKGTIAGDAATKNDALPVERLDGARRLLDERSDERVLKSPRDGPTVAFEIVTPAYRMQDR